MGSCIIDVPKARATARALGKKGALKVKRQTSPIAMMQDGTRFIDLRRISAVEPDARNLPFTYRIILENHIRNAADTPDPREAIAALKFADALSGNGVDLDFWPSRVIMQDSAGFPALIDLAAFREKALAAGLSVASCNPKVPTHLVIDHSVMAHYSGSPEAIALNQEREFHENRERFNFLKWTQRGFDGISIIPPGRGIIHQIHIERLAEVASKREVAGQVWEFPDTVIGTDSHTTMVNGIGVLGWGVGGIEAEAVMLGESISMVIPPVVGVKLTGKMPKGSVATDIALRLSDIFRRVGVVGSILEFCGPGASALTVADRATISNMSPEFGATSAIFPPDQATIDYLRLTGRRPEDVARIEAYLRRAGLWFDPTFMPDVTQVINIDLSEFRRTVSGPSRPDQVHELHEVPDVMRQSIGDPDQSKGRIRGGDVVIAAITSCTNTSNPEAMIAAGLLARRARQKGMTVAPYVKTTLAPGSRAVMSYLKNAELADDLSELGFALTAFGCTTCVGNSGELVPEVSDEIRENNLNVAAVLSGNRNFDGRIHALVQSNFLASPALVVAYAIAGSVLVDLDHDPIGTDSAGGPVYLADICPEMEEIKAVMEKCVDSPHFVKAYERMELGDKHWETLDVPDGPVFPWAEDSSYVRRSPFLDLPPMFPEGEPVLADALSLLILGDDVTTDHISPVGEIPNGSEAAKYLSDNGIAIRDFNSYGSRRGNHEVMVRGTYANARLRNELSDRPGGHTRILPEGTPSTIYGAACVYKASGQQTIVIAGARYGVGSARDWAAKGTRLLNVRCVIAESFERIHRSNLVRMGVLPLQFMVGEGRESLSLTGDHRYSISATIDDIAPRARIVVAAASPDGAVREFEVECRVDTVPELQYLRDGGILPSIAMQMAS